MKGFMKPRGETQDGTPQQQQYASPKRDAASTAADGGRPTRQPPLDLDSLLPNLQDTLMHLRSVKGHGQ